MYKKNFARIGTSPTHTSVDRPLITILDKGKNKALKDLFPRKKDFDFAVFSLVFFDFLPSNFEAPTWSAQVCSILERLQAGRRRGADQLWEIRLFNA